MAREKAASTNRMKVFRAIKASKAPRTAYQILHAVRDDGITAPPTVYRILTRLVEEGLIHRIESLNAYVACADEDHHHDAAVFAICEQCGRVEEMEEKSLVRSLIGKAASHGFKVERTTIELKGLCASCPG